MTNALIPSSAMKAAEQVANDILDGMSLRKACAKLGMRIHDFHSLLGTDKEAAAHYARASEFRADVWADEIIEIADEEGDSGATRNKIEARKWLASKLKPKTYGDRIDLNVSQTLDIAGTLALAQQRLRPIGDLQQPVTPYVIDSSCVIEARPTDTQSALPGANAIPDIFD